MEGVLGLLYYPQRARPSRFACFARTQCGIREFDGVFRDKSERGQSLAEVAIFIPIVIVMFLALGDLARVFATMITIESAAREAADWGAYRPGNWTPDSDPDVCAGDPAYVCTVKEMERRACTAALGLLDYAPQPSDGSTCTNPSFTCAIGPSNDPVDSCNAATDCHIDPCYVKVTLTYTFELVSPSEFIALPSSFTFGRTSTFAIGKDPSTTP
jgi:hypothetical protein